MSRGDEFFVGSSPVPEVEAASKTYAQGAGIRMPPNTLYSHIVMPESVSRSLASAYDRMPSFDSSATPAYKAMREETGRQYDTLTKPTSKGGLGIDVSVQDQDPYGGGDPMRVIPEMRADVLNNHHIGVISTKATGGHPGVSNDDNDMFRAVHDVFGHLGSGRGVDFDGEEAAYQKHSRMYSPLARQALATETRGQTGFLRANGYFGEQKLGLLPEHMQALQFARQASPGDLMAAVGRARAKNEGQGIT